MKKTYHAESVINTCWRKLTGLLPMAGLGAVIGLGLAAVFSAAGGVAKAQTGTEAADSNLLSSFNQFFGLEETEAGHPNEYLIAAYHTGEWQSNPLAFHVPASQQENTGALSLQVDRALAGEDLVLALTYADDNAKGSLYIGLSYWPEGADLNENERAIFPPQADPPVADLGDLFGNIMQGQGEITTAYFEIPVQSFQDAQYLSVDLYGEGEITIFGAVLYTKSEFYYWLEQALVQGGAGLEREEVAGEQDQGLADSPSRAPGRLVRHSLGDGGNAAAARGASGTSAAPEMPAAGSPGRSALAVAERYGGARPAEPGVLDRAPLAERIAAAAQVAANLMITRSVLSGGGARQGSANFIMEDTFAQPGTVGFSWGNGIMLHAGYQQADDQLLEIWNPAAVPSTFNPLRGEKTTLSFVLSTRPRSVSIEVSNTVSGVTNVLVNNAPQGPGLRTFLWDGRDTNGNYLSLDPWIFWIRALDYRGRVIATNTPVRLRQIPVIRSVSDSPDPFCPATDLTNAIFYTTDAAQNLDVTLAIEDASGNPVANFSTNNQLPGSYVFNWDGTGATRDGLYVYRINARRGQAANEKSGSIILACGQECAESADGLVRVCYQPDGFSIAISNATPAQLSEASRAVLTAVPRLLFQGRIYDIQASPPTNFVSPAILSFQYDSAIVGDIDGQLSLRRYDPAISNWVIVLSQFVDYANNQIIAEVSDLSLFTLLAAEAPTAPGVLSASVRLEPEILKVNPGILTAFVSLPEGFAESGIVAATCEGAPAESMALSADGTEMIVKFRRRAIEEALAEQGEALDTHFVVEGTWQGAEGPIPFVGEDDIARIIH